MTNHFHLVVETEGKPSNLIHYFRESLTAYYNGRHNKHGSLGTRKCGYRRIIDEKEDSGDDLRDIIAYVLRNPLWHGTVKDPYKYDWSSIKQYFSLPPKFNPLPKSHEGPYLPYGITLPKGYSMDERGLIIMQNYVNSTRVEELFGTAANFYEKISRPSQTELKKIHFEQKKHPDSLILKQKRSATIMRISDTTITETIQKHLNELSLKKRDTPHTIPQMTTEEKYRMVRLIKKEIPKSTYRQLSRIMGIPETSLRRRANSR
ncbi:MAG: hypothetical protein LKI53_08865 [Bacteroidales bacterium]|jgi:hypothetical protein|nr:hypothetical protein [Bacteroidales bacterium]